MTPLVDRPQRKRPFACADILSQLGETIFLPDIEKSSRSQPHDPSKLEMAGKRIIDEEPERWDGLS